MKSNFLFPICKISRPSLVSNKKGTHQSSFKEHIAKTIKEFFNKNYEYTDIRNGIVAAIALNVNEPVFESQTKIKLGSTQMSPDGESINKFVGDFIKQNVDNFLHIHPDVAEVMENKIKESENQFSKTEEHTEEKKVAEEENARQPAEDIVIDEENRIRKRNHEKKFQKRDLYKEISENINLSEIKGNTYFSFDKNLIDLENINYNKLLEHIGSVDEDDCKNYEKNRDIKLKREAIERDIVKIAQYCAYWGVKVNQENQYDKARMFFRHAIALDSRYKQFFLLVKSERRSKAENNQIIATSEEIISNPNSTSERQYEALKQKIQILQEESNNSELYNTLYDLLKISKNIEKTESTITEIGAYIDQLLQLTNLETEAALKKGESISATKYIDINELAIENNQINIAQNSIETLKNYLNREAEVLLNSGKQVNVNRYIEISDIAISNKQPETAIYLLYCAKELSKLSLSRRDSLETNKDINNKISTIVNDFDLERNIVFQTQSSAESLGSSLEKIKEQADVQLFSDVKSILAKINDIYDKSNNSGILNEIENNIKI